MSDLVGDLRIELSLVRDEIQRQLGEGALDAYLGGGIWGLRSRSRNEGGGGGGLFVLAKNSALMCHACGCRHKPYCHHEDLCLVAPNEALHILSSFASWQSS